MGVGSLERSYVSYPDDPTSNYAVMRAWDRHLRLMGLLPIGTSNTDLVGKIELGPNRDGREIIVYGFDEQGHISSWREVVSSLHVQKDTCHEQRRAAK